MQQSMSRSTPPSLSSSSALRLRYLRSVRDHLSPSATVTSSVLEVEHNLLASKLASRKQPLHPSEERCPACGFQLSQNATATEQAAALINQNHKQARQRRLGRTLRPSPARNTIASQPSIVFCVKCNNRTPASKELCREAQRSECSKSSNSMITKSSPLPSATNEAAILNPSKARFGKANSNSSSKKRAKARKTGGLKAILREGKPDAGPKTKLDLMDFLTAS